MLQLGKLKTIRYFFLILNIKISFVIYSYIIHLYNIRCMIFGMRCKRNLENMLEKMLYHARMTWWFGKILGRHTSERIYGRNIFSIWCQSVSHDAHNLARGTKACKFTVRLPHTPAAPFHSFCMRSEW
jgi:hypothetical protein